MHLKVKLYILLQHLLPQHTLSRLAGFIADCRWKWLKRLLINNFIKQYNVDLSVATIENADDYPNFTSFFTRQLKPISRPIATHPNEIASPVDGCVSQAGTIRQYSLFQAKGHTFNLLELLGGKQHLAQQFFDGKYSTLYLAPKDYHRVHMPLRGTLTETIYIPGKLFSVSQQTTQHIPQLFSRNERLICIFSTDFGMMGIILVGAMLVSGIETSWPSNFSARTLFDQIHENGITLEKGAELGHFRMGSTVILLFPKDTIEWIPELQENATIRMGAVIGKIR